MALREAAARLGWIVVEEVSLEMSGWSDREAAEVKRRALEPIRAGKPDTLMVWALDRVTRRGRILRSTSARASTRCRSPS